MALNGNGDEAHRAAATAQMFQQAEMVLKSMQIPQAIRNLPVFDGNPVTLHNFLRSIENLMPFLTAIENTPFHDVWLQSIRAKIIGDADQILEIYGTPLNWEDIKANLIAYYNDKRDSVTLTRELFQQQQTNTIEQFFGRVHNLLSLLINHTNISINDNTVKQDRIETHKENALQVFLAGLKEPIGGNVRARKPTTLKAAFDACVEERNYQAKTGLRLFVPPPPKQVDPVFGNFQPWINPQNQVRPYNNSPFIPRLPPPNKNVFAPKQFPIRQPRPIPMDLDRSIRTKQVNYVNRPNFNAPKQALPPPQQNNRNFFQQRGPPRFYVEELHNTDNLTDPPVYDSYNGSYYYTLPNEYYNNSENDDKLMTEPEQFEQLEQAEKPQILDQDELKSDNLNFLLASDQRSIT